MLGNLEQSRKPVRPDPTMMSNMETMVSSTIIGMRTATSGALRRGGGDGLLFPFTRHDCRVNLLPIRLSKLWLHVVRRYSALSIPFADAVNHGYGDDRRPYLADDLPFQKRQRAECNR